MKISTRSIAAICVSICCSISLAQQNQSIPAIPEQAMPPYQISFFLPVETGTVNQLIQLFNTQINLGRKDFIILISSGGGEVLSGLAAYNYLHGLKVNITTYNLGQVDSAASLLYCAGTHRYALPNSRFLIHSSFTTLPPGTPLNTAYLDGQVQQVNNMNQLSSQIIEQAIGKKSKQIEEAIQGQSIFSPQQAVDIGLAQEIKTDFATPGAVIAAIDQPQDGGTPTSVPQGTLTSQGSSQVSMQLDAPQVPNSIASH